MRRQHLIAAATAVGLALGVSACTPGSADGSDRTLRFAHGFDESHPVHACFAGYFADRVNDEIDGVRVDVLASGTAGSEAEILDQVNGGDLDFAAGGPSEAQRYYAPMGVFNAAFAFDDADHLDRVWDSEIGAAMQEGLLENSELRMLEVAFLGNRHFTSNTPIRTPDDLDGLRLRAPDVPVYIANAEAMGATPTPVDFAELYLALQQGVVDAQENPISTIDSLALYEVQEYVSLSAHAVSPGHITVNESTWQSLDQEQQDAMLAIAKDAGDELAACGTDTDAAILDRWEAEDLVTIVDDVDREAFAERVVDVLPQRFPEWNGVYEQIRDLTDE